jgi:malonyl CoA-acyl carrier protein transacylase
MRRVTTLCFPGQGSQYGGMCVDYLTSIHSQLARKMLFDDVDRVLGSATGDAVRAAMFNTTDSSALVPTQIQQPAIFLHSALAFTCTQSHWIQREGVFCIGHSVGEFAALYAAGLLSFETALSLVVS